MGDPKIKLLLSIAVVLLFALVFICLQVFFYLKSEQPIYYWDYKSYWMMWQEYALLLSQDFGVWLKQIVHAVRYNDYNPLSIALLFPFHFLPFSARANYLLATSICYLLPVSLLVATVFRRFQGFQSGYWFISILLLAVTYPLFWGTIFRGFPDIAGLIPVLLVILYVLRVDLSEKISLKSIFILGVLLWLPFGLRRWYAFTIVCLYLTLPFFSLSISSLEQAKRLKKFAFVTLNFCGAGIVSVLLVVLFQYELLKTVLQTNYAHLYHAYNEGFLVSFRTILIYLGLYLLPVFAVGLCWAFSGKRSAAKNFVIFCFVNLVVCFLLFAKTQTPGDQHVLPFSLWIFFISVFGLYWIAEKLKGFMAKKFFLIGTVLIAFFIHLITFYKINGEIVLYNRFSPVKYYPLQFDNFDNYKKMAADIEAYTAAGEKVAVISAGRELNEDLILTLTEERIKAQMAPQAQVDLMQGLVLERFQAKYVVVADPPTLHLAQGQNVVSIPSQELLSGTGIGAAYKRLPDEYVLDNGKKGVVFEKMRPFTQQELTDFIDQFVAIYPEWEEIYAAPFVLSFVDAQITLGDNPWSTFQLQKDGSVLAHPDESKPVMVEWTFGDISQLMVQSVDISCRDLNHAADGVAVILKNEDGAYKRVEVPYLEAVSFDVTEFANKRGELIIEPNAYFTCDMVRITASKH